MAPGTLLQRNVRPAAAGEDADDGADSYDEESVDDRYNNDQESLGSDEGHDDELEGDDADLEEDDVKQRLNHVSFGALLEAQEAISRKRKRGSETTADQEAKLEGIRSRLQEIRSQKESRRGESASNSKKRHRSDQRRAESKGRETGSDSEEDDSDSDSAPSEEDIPTRTATSKHAPSSQTSKRQVTRKRTVIHVPKKTSRDPRFDALRQTTTTQPSHSEKAYSFLREYQQSEISELKSAIKTTRNDEDRAILTRKVVSMENRLKSKDAKDRAQEVLRKYRKEEKDKVQQGKRPYFLKKSELKERALVEKFEGMKSKEREKLMEKRKRKESQKEMKRMPNARRVTG